VFDAEQHSAPLMHGAVMRLEGRLLKQSGLGWQQRKCNVDNFRFKYLSRHGDSKSLGAKRAHGARAAACGVRTHHARRVHRSPLPLACRQRMTVAAASADLVEVDRVAIVSEDRLEFTLHTRSRSGKNRTFRALTKQEFKSWTLGLQQYVHMAQAYYDM
jgi:hypothetical protein